jgi:hypothetical protein
MRGYHQPPSGLNRTNDPEKWDTMNPTSSMWAASMTRGRSARPLSRAMHEPRRSFSMTATGARRRAMSAAISPSNPGTPVASVNSFINDSMRSIASSLRYGFRAAAARAMRSTSSSNASPAAFAAIGTRLSSVMPGSVLTSRQYGSPPSDSRRSTLA